MVGKMRRMLLLSTKLLCVFYFCVFSSEGGVGGVIDDGGLCAMTASVWVLAKAPSGFLCGDSLGASLTIAVSRPLS